MSENKILTSGMIMSRAKSLFEEPKHLARKAAINYCHELEIESESLYQEQLDAKTLELLDMAKEQPERLINEYGIRSFSASRSWISKFMKRHKYVFRKPHYTRRGAIKKSSIDAYISQLSEAIQRYPPSRILNMDETFVRLDNLPSRTITHQGEKTVKVERNFVDSKAGTTYIGTIAMDPTRRFPLYCIAKGKTPGC